ncbi:UDP-N-acetylmuramoyl-tripeptide--D-alanyl-D-alanine ligase [Flavobacterium rivuli WB 3.3-2 = DSM 21788]|uniref:UDP-N-acetylmuramoyl-tripeptide--D-alanyl-D-alanine ligase n=1 Tax=Flavobacterium rivuli WB 3.3-2 = DSM 21788 TaxID=1121895 RepID=A0A0A2M3Z0_9FLAO|nr:UDP-N-acetylmuramoyl-tripeptide--D-alanyl-D-alanine ligase [Flavobacterium rivuli]KGO87362.1 UDP-N-acetylmuramoyl-tripeptide--D-alanyl-D-alanine ligase [Flavobacterium rivuli WB 3.3-2 = DSM 21788]
MEISQLYQYFTSCSALSTDTRKIMPNSIFFALKGDNFDANTFASEALNMGARYVVIDNPAYKTGDRMLLVENTLEALQQLAQHHRRQLGLPVIALTGSNGKTTTKELVNAVLSKKYSTKATVGNLNNHIGVPLTLLSFTTETEIGIVEMGANHQKEIEMLCELAEPNFGYITNFGKAHLEGFGGYDGVIKGKSELYTYLETHTKTAFVNLDDEIQDKKTEALSRFTFATNSYDGNVRIDDVDANPMVRLIYNDLHIQSHLIGIYNASNISAAIAIGNYFKVADSEIKAAIENYIPTNNRSQLTEKNGNKIILDAYNANPSSMMAALTNFVQLDEEPKIAILGDMFELGTESLAEHKKLVQYLAGEEGVKVIFVGNDFYANKIKNSHLHFFKTYEDLKNNASVLQTDKKALILIKGSRGMALERVLDII